MGFKRLHIKGSFASNKPVVLELEEAKYWDYNDPWNMVVVEEQLVRSYEELCAVASQEHNKDKEVLEVYFLHSTAGG